MDLSPDNAQLTQEDIARLMRNPSADERAATAMKVSYQLDRDNITDSERAIATDVLRILAGDAALQVRQAIVESLKTSPHLPKDIALKLASDIEVVALPLLEMTPTLNDEDLANIVKNGRASKQTAIARRPFLSSFVTDVLAEHGVAEAVESLVLNPGADLSSNAYNFILDRFEHEGDVAYNLAHRQAIPANVMERLVASASEEIKHILEHRPDLPEELVQQLANEARERITISFIERDRTDDDLYRLIKQLQDHKRLNSSMIMRAICAGDLKFFEVALAATVHVPVQNARLLIHDKGSNGLRSIYQRSGLPMMFLPAVRHALNLAFENRLAPVESEEAFHQKLLERIWADPQTMSQEDIDHFFSKLGSTRALSKV